MVKLLGRDIKLAIFDLDGTLIDSTSIWADIDSIFFSRRNLIIPPTYGEEIAHIGLENAAKWTKEKYLPNEKEEDILNEWKELSFEQYKNTTPLKENALELLSLLKSKGVHIALATANSKEIYEVCMHRLDIFKYFEYVIDVNSFKEGKNSPAIYDSITKKFNVRNDETIIFEDMIVPIKTAYKAGYNVIGVFDKHSSKNKDEDIRKHSMLFIRNFKEIIDLIDK